MSNNINDDTLNNQTNTQSENFADKVVLIDDTKAIIQNQETENMEVHHHPDLRHKPKKWKEYFLEFLMIFLAVTMGFFAESYREHLADKEKVKHAIGSLVKCLASDTAQLNVMIQSNLLTANYFDSLLTLKNADLSKSENKQKFYDYSFSGFTQDWYFKTNDAAMQEIKSNGILGLIENQKVTDSIFGYEVKNKVTVAQEADNYYLFKEFLPDFKKVVDFTLVRESSTSIYDVSDKFFSFHFNNISKLTIDSDKEKLKNIFKNASFMAVADEAYAQFMKDQKEYAINLIALLNREYHSENK